MYRFSARVLIALLTFFLGVAATAVWLVNRPLGGRLPQAEEVALIVKVKSVSAPDFGWMPIYFESVNERVKAAKLPNLRASSLPEGDLEVRVWGGFGLTALEGFILKRAAGQWSAIHLDGIHPGLHRSKYQERLRVPKSGWEGCWLRLVNAGLLVLPDDSVLEGKKLITDGFSYVVEINESGSYRAYRYSNPAWQDWEEAKRMIEIGEVISEEFGLPEFSVKE